MNDSRIESIKRNPATLRCYKSRINLKADGKEFIGSCPFHSERTPSFKVYEKSGLWFWTCHGACSKTGNVIQFVQQVDGVTFEEAMSKIESEIGSWESKKDLVDKTFKPVVEDTTPKRTFNLKEYEKLELGLAKSPEAREWLLKERGIDYATARKLHFGFRQDLGKIAGDSDLADKGWISIPCVRGDEVCSIEYRSIQSKDFRRQPNMATCLFNTDSIDVLETIFVTEGKLDSAALVQAGYNAVSLPSAGYKLTPQMRDELKRADSIILAGDSDAAGESAMSKLWAELGDRTYLLKWPSGMKDANETLVKACGADTEKFRALVNKLADEARSVPMPNVTSLKEAMTSSRRVNMSEHPDRLRFPWKSVDAMTNILPGNVLSVMATQTGQGKTTWVMNVAVAEARRGEVVLNYSEELDSPEYANLVAAHLLKKDRNTLTEQDYADAALKLGSARFYIGRNLDLNTADEVLDLIEAAIRRLGPSIVIIDHLHIIVRNVADPVRAQDNAMKRILSLATKYKVKMIVIGQPRKANQQSKGKRVHITDAKGAASFGDDANAFISLHRDVVKNVDPNNPPREPYEPKTEVHLLKGRSQGTGNAYAELMFFGSIASFESICRDVPPEQQRLS